MWRQLDGKETIVADRKTAVTENTRRKPRGDQPQRVKGASSKRLGVPHVDAAAESQSLQMAYRSGLEGVAMLNRVIAHALNNVLGISRGNLTLLRGLAHDLDSIEMTDDVLSSLNDLEDLSSSLASLESGASFTPVDVEMAKFLPQLAHSLRDSLSPGCKLTLAVDKAVLPVHTDPRFLQLTIQAVVSNAAQAIKGKGVVRIDCTNRVDASGRNFVRICIRDTGQGFGLRERGRAFELGFSTKKGHSHVGIGLWFARQFALATGGDASLGKDADKQGAAINIDLPSIQS